MASLPDRPRSRTCLLTTWADDGSSFSVFGAEISAYSASIWIFLLSMILYDVSIYFCWHNGALPPAKDDAGDSRTCNQLNLWAALGFVLESIVDLIASALARQAALRAAAGPAKPRRAERAARQGRAPVAPNRAAPSPSEAAQSPEPQSPEPQSSEPQSHEPQSHEPQSHEPQSSEPQSSEPQ
jgi:hypothetical protein